MLFARKAEGYRFKRIEFKVHAKNDVEVRFREVKKHENNIRFVWLLIGVLGQVLTPKWGQV